MKKIIVVGVLAFVSLCAQAQSAGRDNFLKQQAYAEMQRVTRQIDVLQSSHDELAERVSRMDGGKGELSAVKADVAALRAEIASLRREMDRMRAEIVADITKKVTALIKTTAVSAPQPTTRPSRSVPRDSKTYTVQAGDTLSLISQAFGTSVSKLKEMNGLKSDRLRIGQKLIVPKPEGEK